MAGEAADASDCAAASANAPALAALREERPKAHNSAMPRILSTRDPGFEAAFGTLLAAKRESASDVDDAVAAIIDAVAARGDAALVEYTNRFVRVRLTPERLRLSPDEIAAGAAQAPPATVAALHFAAARIESFHRKQLPADIDYV